MRVAGWRGAARQAPADVAGGARARAACRGGVAARAGAGGRLAGSPGGSRGAHLGARPADHAGRFCGAAAAAAADGGARAPHRLVRRRGRGCRHPRRRAVPGGGAVQASARHVCRHAHRVRGRHRCGDARGRRGGRRAVQRAHHVVPHLPPVHHRRRRLPPPRLAAHQAAAGRARDEGVCDGGAQPGARRAARACGDGHPAGVARSGCHRAPGVRQGRGQPRRAAHVRPRSVRRGAGAARSR